MDYNQLLTYLETLVDLKNALKCAICLDVTLNVIELECTHRFCETCFQIHKSYDEKNIECPLCKQSLGRRCPLYKDKYADALSAFVREGCKIIKSAYNIEVEKLYKCLKDCKQLSGKVSKEQIRNLCETKVNIIVPNDVPSTSNVKMFESKENANVNENVDVFDRLLDRSPHRTFNKQGTRKTYYNKRKKQEPDNYEILQFDDDDNKIKIINWLNDSKNKFNRLSQTQVVCKSQGSQPMCDFNFPSVSQQNKNQYLVLEPTQYFKRNLPRSKSVDRESSNQNERRVKRHSLAGDIQLEFVVEEEEKIVEQAERKVIQNLLEDECLDNFEEIIQSSLEDPSVSKPKSRKEKASPDSGWDRLKNMKKTIRKGDKKPKKLNITLESNSSNSKIKGDPSVNELDISPQNTVIAKKNEMVEQVNQGNLTPTIKLGRHIYDLETLENYIASNMVFIDKSKSSDVSSNNITENENETQKSPSKDISVPAGHLDDCKKVEVTEENSSNANTVVTEIQQVNKDLNSSKECKFCGCFKEKSQNLNLVSDLLQTDTGNSTELIDSLHNHLNNIITKISSEKDHLSKLLTDCFFNINSYLEKFKDLHCKKIEKRDAAVQTTIISVNTKEIQTENMFKNALIQTEILNHCDKNVQTEELDSGEKIEFNCIPTSTTDENVKIRVNSKLDSYETTIKNVENEELKLPQDELKLVVQMDQKIPISQSITKDTPTRDEDDQNLILTNSLDNFNFETQEVTKLLQQKGETFNASQKLNNKITNGNKINSEVFQNGSKKQSGSVLLVSLEDEAQGPKKAKINRKLTFSQTQLKKFKRIRETNPNSDSENEENSPKRICNRFVRSDLTIQFTETEKNATQATQNSNSKNNKNELTESESMMDYDEYLDEVLKRYDTPTCTPSKPPSKSQTQAQLDDKDDNNLAELLDKCDQLIHQATKAIVKEPEPKVDSESESFPAKKANRKLPSTKSSTDSSQNNQFTCETFFMNEHNLQELDKRVLEYEQSKMKTMSSECSDIIGETESMNPVHKKHKTSHHTNSNTPTIDENAECKDSESIFNDEKNLGSQNQLNITQENLDSVIKLVNKDIVNFDDELDAEIEEIHSSAEKKNQESEEQANIVILDDVKVKSQDRNGEKIEDVLRPLTIEDSSDEVFSDDDIVESTPQKDKSLNRTVLSQLEPLEDNSFCKKQSNESAILPTSENIIEALPPPPGFEDEVETSPSKEQITVVDKHTTLVNKSSLTPDSISQLLDKSDKENEQKNLPVLSPRKRSQPKSCLNLSKRLIMHSTPNTENFMVESLGMSPICRSSQQVNFVEVAKSASNTPLVVKPDQKKMTIMTSTPKQKSMWNFVKTPQEGLSSQQQASQKRKPCVACTRLSKDQMSSLSCLTNKKLITVSSEFTPLVTHMIVSVNDSGCVKDHTVKYVLAVASGIWVLKHQWVQDCINSNSLLPEEHYEARDVSGNPGPKMSRLTRKTNPLFKGFKFYCAQPFANLTKEDVEQIIKMLGGKSYQSPEDLTPEKGVIRLIITETSQTEDFDKFETWLELYRVATVDVEWLIKSVGQYKVLSIRPYVLCSDDFISEMGYPPHLVEAVPFSFSEPH